MDKAGRRFRQGLGAALAVCLLTGGPSLLAGGLDVSKQYKAAVKLEVSGDVLGALKAFEEIPEPKRDFNTRLHIAGCKKKLGRLLAAEADYEAIRTDKKADQPTIDTAASDLEDLRPRIPIIKVRTQASSSSVEVTLDERTIVVPSATRVDPGDHVVRATRGGEVVFERKLHLDEGSTVDVLVELPTPALAPVKAPEKPAASKPIVTEARSSDRMLGWTFAGLTALFAGSATWFTIQAIHHVSDRDDLASKGDPASLDAADRARSAQLWGRLSLVGVVGSAVTSGYFFWSSSKPHKPHVAVGLRTLDGVAFTIAGGW